MYLPLRLLAYARPYWPLALGASLCLVGSGFLNAYPIQLFRRAVDIAAGDVQGTAPDIALLAGLYLGLRLALGLVGLAESQLSKRLVQNLIFDLRSDLFQHLQRLSLRFFHSRGSGDVMSRALGDAGAVAGGFMNPVTRLAGELTTLAWALVFLVRIDLWLTLASLIAAPPLGYAVYLFGNRMRTIAGRMREVESDVWSQLAETVAGIAEIKVFQREPRELERFRERSREADRLGLQDSQLNAVLTFLSGLLFSLGEAAVLLLGGLGVYRRAMTAGELAAFLMYLRMLYNPVITLSRRYDQTQRTLVSAMRVFEVFDTPPEVPEKPGAAPLATTQGEVQFDQVWFGYQPGRPVLRGVCFIAEPGALVALVGRSGAGKTTIARLIPRLYDPDRGFIRIGGIDLRDVTLGSLRSRIAVVFQEPYLFGGTIAENIAFGRPGARPDEIRQAARAANADEFIEEFADGYATAVGERGVRLSGGQKQRIAIARALLKAPAILILDEATSSVDTRTERLIQEAFDRLLKGRTALVIAHRLSTILHADSILVIEGGRIAEQGRHRELLSMGGLYIELYLTQFGHRSIAP